MRCIVELAPTAVLGLVIPGLTQISSTELRSHQSRVHGKVAQIVVIRTSTCMHLLAMEAPSLARISNGHGLLLTSVENFSRNDNLSINQAVEAASQHLSYRVLAMPKDKLLDKGSSPEMT